MAVTNGIPLGCLLLLPVDTLNLRPNTEGRGATPPAPARNHGIRRVAAMGGGITKQAGGCVGSGAVVGTLTAAGWVGAMARCSVLKQDFALEECCWDSRCC
jgi:hypothetical protein